MVKKQLFEIIKTGLKKIGIEEQIINLEVPANPDFGDYSTNIAFQLTKKLKQSPFQIAEQIVKNLSKNGIVEKIEVVKPGFINFYLSIKTLLPDLVNLSQGTFNYFPYHLGSNKNIMVEFAHPNTHKLFHIGHLRNISIGESVTRILETAGNRIVRSNYQGDVGLHIAKTLWYIKNKIDKKKLEQIRQQPLTLRMHFLGEAYAIGQVAYDENEQSKKEIIDINRKIYDRNPEIFPLWQETKQWSLDYFDAVYKRVYSHFDRLYLESEFDDRGKEICSNAEKKGILTRSQGALVFKGKPYGLDTRVFINSLGFPTYEGKEIALAEKEFSEFGELDKNIHVVTPEQTSFFKVTFKVEELLNEKKYKNKQYHLAYEWVKLKQGKMSSRTGNVVEAEWLIDEAKKRLKEKYKLDDPVAETIAVAAVKYSFLKNNVFAQIAFDINESISLEGNSGPYLLYTYVRTQSVLKKSASDITTLSRPFQSRNINEVNNEEKAVISALNNYQETVLQAAQSLAPNLIANYLYDLAQKFNLFYQKHQILEAPEESKNLRLILTKATGEVLKNGLYLLGIKTVEKM